MGVHELIFAGFCVLKMAWK